MSASRAPASRLREQLAARNGPRHSVYWVQPTAAAGNVAVSRGATGDMAAAARAVEYKVVGKYTGEWRDGARHGFGALEYADGSKYEGEWRAGARHGRGVLWVREPGGGKLRKQYAGEWAADARCGRGTLFLAGGARYDGSWVANRREGRGRMDYGPGSAEGVYEGEWLAGERSGRGSLVLANGDRYDGHWLRDKKEGPGRFFYRATRKVYEGEWVGGTPKCGTFRDLPAGDGQDAEAADADADAEAAESHYKFQLPPLGLARPEQVVSEAVAAVRQERVRGMAEGGERSPEAACEPAEDCAPDEAVVFDDEALGRIRREFSAVLEEQRAAGDTGGGRQDALVACAALPRLMDALRLRVSEAQLETFMAEIGASPATRVSFAECVDMLSLLAEGEAQDAFEAARDDDDDDDGSDGE